MKTLIAIIVGLWITAGLLWAQGWPPKNGSTLPATCTTGQTFYLSTNMSTRMYECVATDQWSSYTTSAGSGGVPTGAIFLILAGTCPATYTEQSELAARTLVGTVAANLDVGTTGGSDSITQVLNHTHTVDVTDPGHSHVTQRFPTTTGGSSGFTADTSMSGTPTANTLTTASGTTGITATTQAPGGGVSSIDNRSAFTKVIFCRKD